MTVIVSCTLIFFFNDTPTTEIYTLSLHDALPISLFCVPDPRCDPGDPAFPAIPALHRSVTGVLHPPRPADTHRSEEHTSELQSQSNLVCRLLLEKKNPSYNILNSRHSTHVMEHSN